MWIGWGKELIKLYNDPYKAIVGGKHPRALGQPASVVWKEIWPDIEPMLKTVMEKDEGTYVESQPLIMERNGYPEETYYTFSYTPIPGDKGGTAGMICANTDDTSRIIGERQLRTLKDLGESLAKMQTVNEVYENALRVLESNQKDFPFAVLYKIDNERRTAMPMAYAGINRDQTVLPASVDLLNPREGTLNFCNAFRKGEMVVSENKGRRKNLPKGAWEIEPTHFIHIPIIISGSNHPNAIISAALNPYRLYDDRYRQFTSLIADQIALEVNNVTAYEEERKRAEALAEIDKAKTAFFSNISHEFRTPLTLMLGPLEELLASGKELREDDKTKIETTHRNALRLLRLVNNLLDFSRIEAGRAKAQFQLTDISKFTKELAANFRSAMETAGLKFHVKCGSVSPAYIDKSMWEKIVLNLLSNAFKFTLQGSVTISLTAKADAIQLNVSDTGIGIPESELPNIFQRFHRVENATGRSHEGTGIGLSLISELVKMHGGNISVTSKVGKGSEFIVTIPSGKEHLPAEQLTETGSDFQGNLAETFLEEAHLLVNKPAAEERVTINEKASILIVDDNSDMRAYIKSLLQKDYHILTAGNGSEALQKIKTTLPSLIVSDVMMPVMNGIDLVKELKENPQTRNIPVILVSARAGEEAKIEGYDIGADDYLVKPFSSKELVARVRSQLHISELRQREENKLKGFFRQAPAAIAVLHGSDHIFTIANPLFQNLSGRSEEQIIGHTIRQIWPEIEGQGIYEIFDRVFSSGESFVANEYPVTFSNRGTTKSGFYDFVVHPIKNSQEEVTDIMVHAFEVTDRIISRAKYQESEKKFREAIDQSPTAIAIIKVPDYTIELVNKKWLDRMGAKLDSLVNKSLFETFPLLSEKGLDSVLKAKTAAGEAHYESEYMVNFNRFGKSGVAYFDVAYQPLADSNGNVNRLMIISHEITDLVEARKKIEESEERKNDFIKMASHELKTPVTSIKGYIQLLLTALSEGDDERKLSPLLVKSSLVSINKQITRLTRLMSELLDLSKIESGMLELNKELFSINEVVIESVQDMLYTHSKHHINIFHDFGCYIYGDKDRIGQVLINLLSNAIKYSPDSDKVEVWIKKERDNVAVSVKDYGIGIDVKYHDRIFERFFRAGEKQEQTFPGFGIGLFIAKEIVERHDGTLKLTSEKGKGAVFTFTLPVANEQKK
jgi:PAS domain S-box-containing protein